MKVNHCSCGEGLVTRDETTRGHCWHCAGLTWRLSLADAELASILEGGNCVRDRLALPGAL